MSKKNKKKNKKNQIVQQKANEVVEPKQSTPVVTEQKVEVKSEKKVTKQEIKKPKKEKGENKLVRRLKETGSELKKVSWPAFSKVLKQTGVVLTVVVFFGLVLFGFDYLLKFLFELLV